MTLGYNVIGSDHNFIIGRDALNASAVIERILGPGPHRYRVLSPYGTGRDDCAMTITLEAAIRCALEFLADTASEGFVLFADDVEPGTFSLEPWRA